MVASITASVAGLVSFGATITGVAQSYDFKGFYDALSGIGSAVTFPCVVAIPDLGEQAGWQSLSMMGNSPKIDFVLEHYLLFAKVAGSADITAIMPNLTTIIDNYFVALKALPFLTASSAPSTHHAPVTAYRVAKSNLLGVQYHSVIFRHKLELYL